MSRAQRDDEFARFVAERSPRLLLLARHLCGDAAMAEDLTQSVLEKAYLKWGPVSKADDPYQYVRRMLVNLNYDRLRRQPWREESRGFEPGGTDPALARAAHSGGDGLAVVLDRLALRDALAELTSRERAVVVLRYLEDLSEADTARELDIRVGTVKSACNRAIGKLREAAERLDDPEVRR